METYRKRPAAIDTVTFVLMPGNRFATLRQSLPHIRDLMSKLEPSFRFSAVDEIDAEFIEEKDIRAVLWDVDGTLMGYHANDIDPRFPNIWPLFRNGPARHAILSNCDEVRYEQLGRMFSEIPVIRGYRTPDGSIFRHKLAGNDTHTAEEVSRILSTGGVLMRKPSGDLIRYGMTVFEISDPQTVLMVGDQYLTDVASANLAGALSAKVPTFKPRTFPLSIRVGQRAEQILYALRTSRQRGSAQ